MSIYLAEEIRGNLKPTPALERRGLNLRAVPMTRVDPIGVPESRQTAYSIYKANLPAFLKAYATGTPLATNLPGYKLKLGHQYLIPIPGPPLMVVFEAKISDEESEELKSLGADAIMFNKSPAFVFRSGTVSPDILRNLHLHPKSLNSTTPTPYGTVNMAGYIEFLRCLAILTSFLRVQFYPAYTGPVEGMRPAGAFAEIKDVLSVLKRSAPESAEGGPKKKARMETDTDDDEDMEFQDAIDMEEIMEIAIGGGSSTIPRANPPEEVRVGYGDLTGMPTIPGNIFPYFDELLDDDFNFVPGVIREYFLESLGDDRKEIISGFKSLKLGFGQFAPTAAGRVLTHLFAGVRLSIMTQTVMYVFLNNSRYTGFTIHGYYYVLSVSGKAYLPFTADQVMESAREIDAHDCALNKIREVILKDIKKNSRAAKAMAAKKTMKFTGPRELSYFLSGLSLSDEATTEIAVLCNDLSFRQTFWQFNAKNILKVCEAIFAGNDLPPEAPMHCTGAIITSDNNVLKSMAVFGDHGFSFKCPNGKALEVPSDPKKITLFDKVKDKKGKMVDPNVVLVLAKKQLRIACSDFDQFYNDHKWLNRDQRSAPFKAVTMSGKEAKEFYTGLVDILPDLSDGKDDTEVIAPRKAIGGEEVPKAHVGNFDFF